MRVGKNARLNPAIWKRYEEAYLTPKSRNQGEGVHIGHETQMRFFESIGVSHRGADTEACIIEHELSGNHSDWRERPTIGYRYKENRTFMEKGLHHRSRCTSFRKSPCYGCKPPWTILLQDAGSLTPKE
ncbi:MAG TPA: hypothetical protein VN372_04695 [Methanospirillum sp.]|nr:hypothetical protein [Methanospirillum sp.]